MFLANASVRRPVAMCCLIIGLGMLGINAYRKMPLELMPKMDVPYITVVTVYPGASPADIEVDVAKRIEDAVSAVDGLKHVSSQCMENVVQTLLEFELGVDVNVAATDVREKIDVEYSNFPVGVEKPIVLKFDINANPVLTVALTGELPLDDLYDYADRELRDRLSILRGVANVELIGGSEREVHVLLDRSKLTSAELGAMHVVQALQKGVTTIPAGRVKEGITEYSVRFDAEYKSVREIGELQVAGKNGVRRFISDLGEVVMSSEERRQMAFIDGRPCIGIRVVKKSDANAVEVVGHVRNAVERLREDLPGGMELVWITDDGAFIQSSVNNTIRSIIIGIILTALTLFFFLYNPRSTLVVSVTMPMTVIISLFFIHILGFSLNISTLLAMGLSVGILVTNSIVVMESIITVHQRTSDVWAAAREGTSEVVVAVIASAGTNVVVLFPIGMMGSLVGMFFRPFAWTMLTVNLVSLFISFTLTPILCVLLLKDESKSNSFLQRAGRRMDAVLDGSITRYISILRGVASRRWLTMAVLAGSAVLFVHALSLAPRIGFGFAPDIDKGEIIIKLEYPTSQGLDRTRQRLLEVEKKLAGVSNLEHMFSSVGKVEGIIGQSSEGVYLAQVLLKFKEKTERKEKIFDILTDIRELLKDHTDCIVTASAPVLVGGQKVPLEMEVAGDDLSELENVTMKVLNAVHNIDGIISPDSTVRAGKPELLVLPQRAILADMNYSPSDIGMMIRANLDGIKAAAYKSGDMTYDIRVKLIEEEGKQQVAGMQMPAGEGKIVPLSGVARVSETRSPILITRNDKRRVAHILANLDQGLPLSTAVAKIRETISERSLLPPGFEVVFRGDFERMREMNVEFLEAGLLAILLTYLTLAAILESFRRPFLILTTIPLGLIGTMWSLWMTHISMSIFVILGFVMLIGIVVNNAVLLLCHMQANREHGEGSGEAMFHAIKEESRPILMITMAAVLGMAPLAASGGLGSELCTGIGVASMGGIAVSAVLTLLVIPLLYLLFARRNPKNGNAARQGATKEVDKRETA